MAKAPHIRRLSLTAQAAYADLLSRIQEDSILALEGAPVLRERSGRKYWYAVQRIGDQIQDRYIGPDSPEVRAQVDRARAVNEDRKHRSRQNSSLANMCREGGMPRIDAQTGKVLLVLSKSGLFRLRAVLVGTHAFRCYPAMLGVTIPEAAAVTEDIDVAAFRSISLALDDHLDPDLEQALAMAGEFVARPNLYSEATAWRDRDSASLVELLTPNQGPDSDTPVELPAMGAFAQPLRFLDYLIHEPVPAVALYRSGLLVNVPQPARYAIHKLIVSVRRHPSAAVKSRKDTEQSAALIAILSEDRPDELQFALEEALERGPRWRELVARGVGRLPGEAKERMREATGYAPQT